MPTASPPRLPPNLLRVTSPSHSYSLPDEQPLAEPSRTQRTEGYSRPTARNVYRTTRRQLRVCGAARTRTRPPAGFASRPADSLRAISNFVPYLSVPEVAEVAPKWLIKTQHHEVFIEYNNRPQASVGGWDGLRRDPTRLTSVWLPPGSSRRWQEQSARRQRQRAFQTQPRSPP